MQSRLPAELAQKSALAGRHILEKLFRLSWRLTGSAGQAQRPEQKSVLAGRRCDWLRALLFLPACLLPFAGPAAAFTNCAKEPNQCCYGIYRLDSSVCSGQGTCTNKVCYCNSDYEGDQCETAIPCGTSGALYSCNGHGTCDGSACLCESKLGYTGYACDIPLLPRLQPAAVDFGRVGVGETAPAASLVLSNWLATSVASIAVTGDAAADFVLGGDCAAGASLAAQGSCTVTASFAPTAPGARSATLSIVTAAAATPLTAALSGTGGLGVEAILIDPATSGRLYGGLDGAGVYVSSDGGASWTAAATQPGSLRVKALAKKSGTPLYAGTYGGGVFKAADGTTAFAACAAQPDNLNVLSLAVDTQGKLYAGTEAGVYVSTDGCANWAAMNGGLP